MITGKFVRLTRSVGASLMAYGLFDLLLQFDSLPSLVSFIICDIFIKRFCFFGCLDLLFDLFSCLSVFH
jgi:hypothetical protein